MKSSADETLLELARQKLETALEQMREHQVPTTPENIMVWYHYVQEDIPQLVIEVEKIIARKTPFSAQLSSQLYQRFFTEMDRRKLELLQGAIRQLITHFSEHIEALTDGMGDFESVLTQCIEGLTGDLDEAALSLLVETLLSESKQAKKVGVDARQKINGLKKEIGELRNSLEELERSALEDALTSVANRRAFDQVFGEQLSLTKSSVNGCCLLLVDIDHFKRFNDKYGHQAGDKVLRFVAAMLKNMTKGQDFVARYGGEEFAIILPSTAYSGGMSLARSLASSLATSRLTIDAKRNIVDFVTVSVGVSWSRKGDTTETMFRRADASLYQAKESGRNRVLGQQDLDGGINSRL